MICRKFELEIIMVLMCYGLIYKWMIDIFMIIQYLELNYVESEICCIRNFEIERSHGVVLDV